MITGCHVLIIEDEPLIAMQLRDILEDEGAGSFDFAGTQESAIAAAASHHPDLITSDVKLIAGSGPLAVKAIQEALGNVPVIFITATPDACVPCDPPGRVLCKPVVKDELVAALDDLELV